MMLNNEKKEMYTNFCSTHPDIPIFSQPWWLDTVCPGQWEVILIKRNKEIIASFPYYQTKIKRIFTHIGMPPLTQKLGPYIVYDKNKTSESKKIGYEHGIYNEIIDKLPKCDSFRVNFDWKYKNWLPFYWRGYKQTTRYTYILDGIDDHNNILKKFEKPKKKKVIKMKNLFSFNLDLSKEAFYCYLSDVIHKRGEKVSYSNELFYRLYTAIYEHQAGRAFYCTDNDDAIHAIKFIIWDKECAYSLIGMRKKEYNSSGATEYLTQESIKFVSQFVNRFDFEGSMIKGVEESYRHYGTKQTEYYSILKYSNSILRILKAIRNN
jgi:hypothetical protein